MVVYHLLQITETPREVRFHFRKRSRVRDRDHRRVTVVWWLARWTFERAFEWKIRELVFGSYNALRMSLGHFHTLFLFSFSSQILNSSGSVCPWTSRFPYALTPVTSRFLLASVYLLFSIASYYANIVYFSHFFRFPSPVPSFPYILSPRSPL